MKELNQICFFLHIFIKHLPKFTFFERSERKSEKIPIERRSSVYSSIITFIKLKLFITLLLFYILFYILYIIYILIILIFIYIYYIYIYLLYIYIYIIIIISYKYNRRRYLRI